MQMLANLFAFNSSFITVEYFYLHAWHKLSGAQYINVWGNTTFKRLTAFYLALLYVGQPSKVLCNIPRKVSITHFRPFNFTQPVYSVTIQQYNTSNDLIINITNTNFIHRPALHVYHYKCYGHSTLSIGSFNFVKRNI